MYILCAHHIHCIWFQVVSVPGSGRRRLEMFADGRLLQWGSLRLWSHVFPEVSDTSKWFRWWRLKGTQSSIIFLEYHFPIFPTYGYFHKWGSPKYPKWLVYKDNPTNMDLGVPLGNLDIIFHSFQFPYPLVTYKKLLKMAIYSWFTH